MILAALQLHRGELAGVVVESTYNWFWLVDGLQAAVICGFVRFGLLIKAGESLA